MKNTWLHSILLIALAVVVLSVFNLLSLSAIRLLSDSSGHVPSILSAPISALAVLVPGLLLGWFTRRHPLLVGASAGLLAPFLASHFESQHFGSQSIIGTAIATGMYVAVAALTGRALRYRLSPLTNQSR